MGKKFTIKLVLLLFTLYIVHCTLYISPAYAQADNIGESRINASSPLYFLKSIREILELKSAGTVNIRAIRELEFATRRIREVKSLAKSARQDLIEPTLKNYAAHIQKLQEILNSYDQTAVTQPVTAITQQIEAVTLHSAVLQNVYYQVSDPRAKLSIRAAIYDLSLAQQLTASNSLNCNFLAKEASSSAPSALNEVEKAVYAARGRQCFRQLEPSR